MRIAWATDVPALQQRLDASWATRNLASVADSHPHLFSRMPVFLARATCAANATRDLGRRSRRSRCPPIARRCSLAHPRSREQLTAVLAACFSASTFTSQRERTEAHRDQHQCRRRVAEHRDAARATGLLHAGHRLPSRGARPTACAGIRGDMFKRSGGWRAARSRFERSPSSTTLRPGNTCSRSFCYSKRFRSARHSHALIVDARDLSIDSGRCSRGRGSASTSSTTAARISTSPSPRMRRSRKRMRAISR